MPSVFVVGCMKAGTTAMFSFLTEHPEIVGSPGKEVNFFTFNAHRGMAWYSRQFPQVTGNQRAVDASPSYFHLALDANVPNRIRAVSPRARAIVMLRDPVDRAVSHFRHLRRYEAADHLADLTADEFFDWDLSAVISESGSLNWNRHLVLRFSLMLRPMLAFEQAFGDDLLVIPMRSLAEDGPAVMEAAFAHAGVEPMALTAMRRRNVADDTDEISDDTRRRLEALYAEDWAGTLQIAERVNRGRWPVRHG